jgi:hypothetical protein
MSRDAIAVFTGKPIETILKDGGTQSWVLDRANARQCRYVVLCRNTHAEWSEGDEPQGSAFMVGRIADVVQSTEDSGRWKILFSDYAPLDIPDAWGSWRNPVKYTTLEELGISLDNLKFRPMPKAEAGEESRSQANQTARTHAAPLTIAEAKKALALTFGVNPESIEITIRG